MQKIISSGRDSPGDVVILFLELLCYFDDETQCPMTHLSLLFCGFTSNHLNSLALTSESEIGGALWL